MKKIANKLAKKNIAVDTLNTVPVILNASQGKPKVLGNSQLFFIQSFNNALQKFICLKNSYSWKWWGWWNTVWWRYNHRWGTIHYRYIRKSVSSKSNYWFRFGRFVFDRNSSIFILYLVLYRRYLSFEHNEWIASKIIKIKLNMCDQNDIFAIFKNVARQISFKHDTRSKKRVDHLNLLTWKFSWLSQF